MTARIPVRNTLSKNGSTILSIAAIVIVIYGMQFAKNLLVPFLVALFLALITVRHMLWMQS
jgi:predicted PurR-regulated permease PerM